MTSIFLCFSADNVYESDDLRVKDELDTISDDHGTRTQVMEIVLFMYVYIGSSCMYILEAIL